MEYSKTVSGIRKPCDGCLKRFDENGKERNCMCKEYVQWFKPEWRAIRALFGKEDKNVWRYAI